MLRDRVGRQVLVKEMQRSRQRSARRLRRKPGAAAYAACRDSELREVRCYRDRQGSPQ
jgi:hypothetical protein